MSLRVELVPLLESARELYAMPRGPARFDAYIELGTKHTEEMQLPISVMNPMAKDHVLHYVEKLIEMDAEGAAKRSADDASASLSNVDEALLLAVVVADDLKGGWTNRTFTEFSHRYERQYEVDRGWAVTLLWTSEEPTEEIIRQRTFESIYRTLHERKHGAVHTLGEIMAREGLTMRFAGRTKSLYDDATLEQVREHVEPNRDSDKAPTVFASLYGDDIAESLGYPALGIPLQGGYELALHDELKRETACAISL